MRRGDEGNTEVATTFVVAVRSFVRSFVRSHTVGVCGRVCVWVRGLALSAFDSIPHFDRQVRQFHSGCECARVTD